MTDIDDFVRQLSPARQSVAMTRAFRACGIDFEFSDGVLRIEKSVDLEEPALLDAFNEELKYMVINDSLTELLDADLIRADGVNEDGEIIYVAV